MKKVLIGGVLLLVILLGLGIWFLQSNLDGLVEGMIEHYGTEMTGTEVEVDSVSISIRDGRGTLTGISVANPEGFSESNALYLGEVSLQIDLASLSGNPVVLPEVLIASPQVNYERLESGKGNLETIRENVENYSGKGDGERGPETEGGEPRRFRIDRFTFREGRLRATAPQLKEEIDQELPSIEMANVGGEQGSPPPELGKEILDEFLEAVSRTVARSGIERMLDQYLGEGAGEKSRDLLDSILQ